MIAGFQDWTFVPIFNSLTSLGYCFARASKILLSWNYLKFSHLADESNNIIITPFIVSVSWNPQFYMFTCAFIHYSTAYQTPFSEHRPPLFLSWVDLLPTASPISFQSYFSIFSPVSLVSFWVRMVSIQWPVSDDLRILFSFFLLSLHRTPPFAITALFPTFPIRLTPLEAI